MEIPDEAFSVCVKMYRNITYAKISEPGFTATIQRRYIYWKNIIRLGKA